jgi:hypothetical protein
MCFNLSLAPSPLWKTKTFPVSYVIISKHEPAARFKTIPVTVSFSNLANKLKAMNNLTANLKGKSHLLPIDQRLNDQ